MSLPREQRVGAIRAALEAALAPVSLEIEDESHRHAGHAGAADGRGHFRVDVVSEYSQNDERFWASGAPDS